MRSPPCGPAATRGTHSHLHPIFALLFHTPSAFSPFPWFWLHGDLERFDVLYFLSSAKGKRDCKKKQLRPLGPFIIFGSVRGLQAWQRDARLRAIGAALSGQGAQGGCPASCRVSGTGAADTGGIIHARSKWPWKTDRSASHRQPDRVTPIST